jgi:hypothetical protein
MKGEEFDHSIVHEIPTICPIAFEPSPALGKNMGFVWDQEEIPQPHTK